tara:strand:+ start:315 stop:557 length:243 start_codon:yes stop_codon:yes gene_type:complete
MDDLMDMMVDDASATAISDKIKEILYTKSAEKIDAARPLVGAELFGDEVPEVQDEPTDETEVTSELETEVEPQEEEEPNG